MKDIFQFLNELREKCRSLTNEKDIFENGVIKVPIEDLDKLIGIVELKHKEIERLKKFLSWEQEEAQGLDEEVSFQLEQLKQVQIKAERYEKAIRECIERMNEGGAGTRSFVYEKLTEVMEGTGCLNSEM